MINFMELFCFFEMSTASFLESNHLKIYMRQNIVAELNQDLCF